MTVLDIQRCVQKAGKSLSRPGLYKHIKALKLKPLGVARPAIYPNNSANRIIKRLGLVSRKSSAHLLNGYPIKLKARRPQ